MHSKWKMIIFCTFYNLLFEFSMRGISGFLDRFLAFWLFWVYFAFFNMVIHIAIISYGSERAVLASTATFGIIPATFVTGVVFINPDFTGLNTIILIIVLIVWWGILQTWFPLYMSGKLFGEQILDGKLNKIGWILCLVYIAVFTLIAFTGATKGALHGYIISIIIFSLLFIWTFIEIWKANQVGKKELIDNEQNLFDSRLLEFGFYATVIISFISGLILPLFDKPIGDPHIYPKSLWLMSIWSILLMIITLIYKLKEKKTFPLPY
ncbi:MAG: hypothetical protein HWN67_08500 [Candidatus Helarchaeota archaeon]|nr:hypothetical protein [Candidatus Helarchaeota archaeon]